MTTRLDVIHHVAAMLGSDFGVGPERAQRITVERLFNARKIDRTVAAHAWGIHDAARSMYNLDGARGSIIQSLVGALDEGMDDEDCHDAVMEVRRYSPGAVCRHCLRPVIEADDALIDDAPRDRAYCPKSRNLTHARATAADFARMGVTP